MLVPPDPKDWTAYGSMLMGNGEWVKQRGKDGFEACLRCNYWHYLSSDCPRFSSSHPLPPGYEEWQKHRDADFYR